MWHTATHHSRVGHASVDKWILLLRSGTWTAVHKRPSPAKPLAYSIYLRLTSPAALISYFPLKKNMFFSFRRLTFEAALAF